MMRVCPHPDRLVEAGGLEQTKQLRAWHCAQSGYLKGRRRAETAARTYGTAALVAVTPGVALTEPLDVATPQPVRYMVYAPWDNRRKSESMPCHASRCLRLRRAEGDDADWAEEQQDG